MIDLYGEVIARESKRERNHLRAISILPSPHQAHHPLVVSFSFIFSHSAPLPDQSESEDDFLSLQSSPLRSSKDEIIVTRDYFIFLLEHVNGRDISKYLTSKHCRFHHYHPDSTVSLSIPDPSTRIANSVHPSKRQIAVLRDLYTQRQLEKMKHNPKYYLLKDEKERLDAERAQTGSNPETVSHVTIPEKKEVCSKQISEADPELEALVEQALTGGFEEKQDNDFTIPTIKEEKKDDNYELPEIH